MENHEMTELEQKQILDQWKQEYGAVYLTEIEGIPFIWRELSRAEYKRVLEFSEDESEREEFVCQLCVLDPIIDDYSHDIYAGVPEVLAKHIAVESGVTSDTTKLDRLMAEGERDMMTFDNQIGCIIKEVFTEFTMEEIENWGLEKTMWYYARAKWMLEVLRGIKLEKQTQEQIPGLPPNMPIMP